VSDCSDLIGLRYKRGADGTNGEIDCINLCYVVLKRLEIETPPFDTSWYEESKFKIFRDLYSWGVRIDRPAYDGDIILIPDKTGFNFAVSWQKGILYCNPHQKIVNWCLAQSFKKLYCFRSRNNL
tara:strand:+ start:973 stop:1347 length:375 start_codon:yes stop_codon:yes gene_type:complete